MPVYTVLLIGASVENDAGSMRHVIADDPMKAVFVAIEDFISEYGITNTDEFDLNEIRPAFVAEGKIDDICPQYEDINTVAKMKK